MPRRLVLPLKRRRYDRNVEVRLFRRHALHGRVVRVKVRVVPDCKGTGGEGGGYLRG